MFDADAPTGSGYWHWVVYNIPLSINELMQGAGNPGKKLMTAGAVQGNTEFGVPGYGGPCPPENDKPHAYIFTVYALKVEHLPVNKTATAATTGFFINQNLIVKASIIIYCKR